MSEIVITSENLPIFAKRLQKSLSEDNGEKVTLHKSYKHLVHAFGKKDLNELKHVLSKSDTKPQINCDTKHNIQQENFNYLSNFSLNFLENNAETVKYKIFTDLLLDIKHFYETNPNTKILNFFIREKFLNSQELCFNLDRNGTFVSHYFDYHQIPLHNESQNLVLDNVEFVSDLNFIIYLHQKYVLDPDNNSYLNTFFNEKVLRFIKNDKILLAEKELILLGPYHRISKDSLSGRTCVKFAVIKDYESIHIDGMKASLNENDFNANVVFSPNSLKEYFDIDLAVKNKNKKDLFIAYIPKDEKPLTSGQECSWGNPISRNFCSMFLIMPDGSIVVPTQKIDKNFNDIEDNLLVHFIMGYVYHHIYWMRKSDNPFYTNELDKFQAWENGYDSRTL
jgi:hypothetical protein